MTFKLRLVAVSFFIFISFSVYAQSYLEGVVRDQVSNEVLDQIYIINISNQEKSKSNKQGEFRILAKVNDLLVFKAIGYRTDTVLVVGLKPLKHFLLADVNNLKTVRVDRIASYEQQYAQVLRKAKAVSLTPGRGLLLSPSRIFGREGRQARYFRRMIKKEQYELEIDRKFNAETITAILPLKQPDLDIFIMTYRPSLAFVRRADADDMKFYLIDAYNKFKNLPDAKKKLLQLRSEGG